MFDCTYQLNSVNIIFFLKNQELGVSEKLCLNNTDFIQ